MGELGVWIVRWLVVINLLTFVLFGQDKRKARRGAWRIPEATLMLWYADSVVASSTRLNAA